MNNVFVNVNREHMTATNSVQQHPASVDAYIRHGWSLVPIPPGTKGPRNAGWNKKHNNIKSQADLPPGYGIGLAHAYSGTMALDVDDWTIAAPLLAQHGVDLKALYDAPDAVIVDSGREGRGKLLYAMPFGLALASKKIHVNSKTAYELRCATANGLTVQDVLPPSIHPDTKQPYRWGGKGHWSRLPVIPQCVLDLWQDLLKQDTVKTLHTGEAVNASWDEIKQALNHIPADVSREEWINVGMALHWAGSQTNQLDNALTLWNEWSAQSEEKYPGEQGIIAQWNSLRTDKENTVKLGTLFHLAQERGWRRDFSDAAELFKPLVNPEDLLESLRPPPPDIDMSLWPKVLSKRAEEVSVSMGCDPLIPLFSGLAAVCGAANAQTRLELMPGYKVPPVLWIMTVGPPADKKSPGSRPMIEPLDQIEYGARPIHKKELIDWEFKEAAYAASKKALLEFAASPDALLNSEERPEVTDLPPPPVPLRLVVRDVTSQKLIRQAAERPEGLLCYLDEMASWIKKLSDRASTEDRSSWVSSYEATKYTMDRVADGSIQCDNLAVSIYGNVQPRVLKDNIEGLTSDGLLQRFIPVILRTKKTKLNEPIPEHLTSATQWEQLLRLVHALPVQTYKMSPDAYDAFRAYQKWYHEARLDEMLLNSSDSFMTAFGKLEGTCGRLILLFHMIEQPFSPTVSVDTVNRVIKIVRGYVIPALRYTLSEIVGVSTLDKWMIEYVIQYADKKSLTLSEIKRSARRQIAGQSNWQASQMIMQAMYPLEEAGWVARLDDGTREHHGLAQWAINAELLKGFRSYRDSVIKAKQRQRDEIYVLNPGARKTVHGYEE